MTRAAKRMRARSAEEDADPEFQVAPMVDVLLVLMIFFMSITSTEVLRNVKGVELPEAQNAKDPGKKPSQIVVNITWLPLTKSSTIIVDDKTYKAADLLVPMFTSRHQKDTKLRILIRADKGVEFSHVAEVMRACSQAQIPNVTFSVIQGGVEAAPKVGG